MTNKKKTYFNLSLGIYSNTKKEATPIVFLVDSNYKKYRLLSPTQIKRSLLNKKKTYFNLNLVICTDHLNQLKESLAMPHKNSFFWTSTKRVYQL